MWRDLEMIGVKDGVEDEVWIGLVNLRKERKESKSFGQGFSLKLDNFGQGFP